MAERISTGEAGRAAYSVRVAYSRRDLQRLYGYGKTKIFADIKAGRLIARNRGTGCKLLFLAADVERWLDALNGEPIVDVNMDKSEGGG